VTRRRRPAVEELHRLVKGSPNAPRGRSRCLRSDFALTANYTDPWTPSSRVRRPSSVVQIRTGKRGCHRGRAAGVPTNACHLLVV
jgi:hypothetical protein